jgi:methyl-accepting chemotaxis protein
MRFLARYSIGAKLLVIPALVTVLLLLIAAVAHFGQQAQQGALDRIYEIRIQRVRSTSAGLNEVRSVNEELFLMLDEYRKAAAVGETDLDDLKVEADTIRSALSKSKKDFESAARQSGLSEDERLAYEDVLTSLNGYGQTLEQLLATVAGAGMAGSEQELAMIWSWFGNFLNSARRLNEIQDRLSGDDYQAAKRIAVFASLLVGGMLLVAILVAVGSALLIRAQIVGAIHGIRDAALQLQSGDLTRRVTLVGSDEVAQSAKAFNELVDGYQGLVRQVLEGARALGVSARALATDAHHAELGAARQSEATEALAATMEQMSASIYSVADGADQMRASSQMSLQGTQGGRQAMERMRDEAHGVQAAFTEIQESVEDFLKRTAVISGLTLQVKDIAAQTNLLALNAAIEAARAGEQGRGFAVVADEVRKLAQYSSGAATHIEQVAAGLESRSESVVQSLQSGRRSMISTLDQLATLQQVMVIAGDAVATTTREIDDIAAAAKEQTRGSTQISANVDEIARMCEQNTHVVFETASAAIELEKLAGALETSVARFRV